MPMKQLGDLLSIFTRGRKEDSPPAQTALEVCPTCGADLQESELFRHYSVCESCNHHFKISARQRIDQISDPHSFKEVNRSLASVDPLSFSDKIPYRERLAEAQHKTGLTDAVVTGTCRIEGKPAMLAVLDFEFMGGSMGSVVGEKIALAFEMALKEKLPIITVSTSGGARMQEGILSLMQMAKTASAAARLSDARLPFISVLADPTTGGILASFASLGDVILAEPGAFIRFAGTRVVQQTMGSVDAAASHTAEFLFAHGMVDQVVSRPKLRGSLSLLLDLLKPKYRVSMEKDVEPYEISERPTETAWQTVQLARHKSRPTSLDYIHRLSSVFVELHGDRLYGDDPAIVCGFAELNGQPVVMIGQERGHDEQTTARNEGRPYPEGYRKAMRAMKLAAKFGMPLITFIDTPGAYPGLESEERGLAMSLASSLSTMSTLRTPIVSAVIGEGGSGGALALGVADSILMMEHAIYSVISPEGCAAILYRDSSKAEEVSSALKLTAHDCKLLGVVDVVVPEPEGGAHTDPDAAARELKAAILRELLPLQKTKKSELLEKRYKKFRKVGQFNSYYRWSLGQIMEHIPKPQIRRDGSRSTANEAPASEKAESVTK